MRTFTLLSLSLLLAACGGGGATAGAAPSPAAGGKASTPSPVGGARAATLRIQVGEPKNVGGFTYLERRNWPDPSLGEMLRYEHSSGMQADVFVYPGPDLATECPLECARQKLQEEIGGFPDQMRAQTIISGFKTTSEAELVPPAGVRWRVGRHQHALVTYTSRGREQHTDYWIVYFPGYRLKVRSTFDETPERIAALEQFLAAVGPAFSSSPTVILPSP
jgi:hypothetical protein